MVIDASVWVAAFLENDAHHQQSSTLLQSVIAEGIRAYAPFLVLSEVAGALGRQTSNPVIAEKAVKLMREQKWMHFESLDDSLATLAATIAAYHRLRGADAVYTAVALQRQMVLVTLDKEMIQRAPARLETMTPLQFMRTSSNQ